MKAFARFKNEMWCMELAYVDKLARDNNGVKYLLVRQDQFDRTVNAKRNESKRFRGNGSCNSDYDYKKESSQKNCVDKGTDFAEEFKKLCKAEGIQIYSTMSETETGYAERTIRSLKIILYRYMEDNGYKYFQKLTQFVTTLNSRRNCTIDLILKNVQNSEFLSILYSK